MQDCVRVYLSSLGPIFGATGGTAGEGAASNHKVHLGIASVSGVREQMGVLILGERRRQARMKLLSQILGDSRLHDSIDVSLVPSSNDGSHYTRSSVKSVPIAKTAHYDFMHYSFINRTLRGSI